MIQIDSENMLQQTVTNRLVCQNALERGWRIVVPKLPSPHMFVDRGDGRELHLFSATAPTTSYAAAHLVDDKYSTYEVLQQAGILQLGTAFHNSEILDDAVRFMERYGTIVVKPVDGGHGKGITVNVRTADKLQRAVEEAGKYKKSVNGALLQEQFMADAIHDVRVAVIDGVAVAAIERIPARVEGDGVHTVQGLIELENQKPTRGEAYRAKLASIDLVRAAEYLGDGMNAVPGKGEMHQVLGVANYGAGGELLDVTDDVPSWMCEEAVTCARLLNLDVAGVDYMVDRPLQTDLTRDGTHAVITEVNKCPALAIHDEPTVGKNRHTVETYLDFIAQL